MEQGGFTNAIDAQYAPAFTGINAERQVMAYHPAGDGNV
jgi:hypothetical protein